MNGGLKEIMDAPVENSDYFSWQDGKKKDMGIELNKWHVGKKRAKQCVLGEVGHIS